MENIIENNKLIAEFLGEIKQPFEFNQFGYINNIGDWKDTFFDNQLKFHSDWNWLMEVVEKIESLDGHLHICDNDVFVHFPKRVKSCTRINGESLKLTKIEAVYNACIEFIKWYNEQTKTMKNIHVLPTDKASKLFYNKIESKFIIDDDFENTIKEDWFQDYNIYITSDEEIKELDKSLLILEEFEPMILTHYEPVEEGYIGKKIILTTDIDLIKDGVQAIDNEFLEWFVKNPNCEEIEVVDVRSLGVYGSYYPYKINIPKKETKQETLEEAKVNNLIKLFGKDFDLEPSSEIKNCNESFMAGAKWQQEQDKNLYSEEEIINALHRAGLQEALKLIK